jgi:hypothetical protein
MSTEDQGDSRQAWGEFRAMVAGPGARKPKARTASGRADYEAHGRRAMDGRSAKRTGRTMKMTLKVKPEFKAKLEAMATARDVGMAEVLEMALDALGSKS